MCLLVAFFDRLLFVELVLMNLPLRSLYTRTSKGYKQGEVAYLLLPFDQGWGWGGGKTAPTQSKIDTLFISL